MKLYHATTKEAAEAIRATGRFLSKEHTQEAFFSTVPDGMITGYGDAVVCVDVPDEIAELDDWFPSGEEHYRVKVALITPAMIGPGPDQNRT